MEQEFDVIIVGTGASGLYEALSLPESYKILVISKDTITNSDSYLAQGGISALLNEEDFNQYYEDTMKAGHYKNNHDSVEVMIRQSPKIISSLISYGVDFDKNGEGKFDYTKEGGHHINRILHKNDATGKEIVSKLLVQVQERSNIELREFTQMIDLVQEDNVCHGIKVKNEKNQIEELHARHIVLATGGLGGLFKNSTNFAHITGDSFGIALKNGIELENIHYIQIHPTSLFSRKKGRRFLISESVRGEGAILLNENKERFVEELLPRDVVTDAILNEMKKFNTEHVYLRLITMNTEEAKARFPKIFQACLEEGYLLGQDDIPVTPAQHYIMGGIRTDQKGRTSMKYLYAVGEAACNGVHGANRLASNSLLESLVFAKEAAEEIIRCDGGITKPIHKLMRVENSEKLIVPDYNKIVLEEIKRKDEKFYDKWCNYEN